MKLKRFKIAVIIVNMIFLFQAFIIAEERNSEKKNPLWKISSGKNNIYILGSVHLLKTSYYPLNKVIEKIFQKSDLIAFEIDLKEVSDQKSQQIVMNKAMLQNGESLNNILGDDVYKKASIKALEAGLDINKLHQYKPWFFAMTLVVMKLQSIGYKSMLGIDTYFYNKALDENKKVIGLETLEYQIGLLDDTLKDEQKAFILQTLGELETLEKQINTIMPAWESGNLQVLESLMLKNLKEHPKVYKALIVKRNNDWLIKIESLIKQKETCMIIAGIAHMLGEDGLIIKLREKGYIVTQQ